MHGGGVQPVRMHQRLAFPNRRIEPVIAQVRAAREAGQGDIRLDRGELERQRRNCPRQPLQHVQFEAFDIDLHEGRDTVPFDQRVERGYRHRHRRGPALTLPARRAVRGGDERPRAGGDRRVAQVQVQVEQAFAGTDCCIDDGHLRVAAVQAVQHADQHRLRFDRHHAAAETSETGDTVADMAADVEGEIAGGQELAVQEVHPALPAAVAQAVDPERAQDAPGLLQTAREGCCRRVFGGRGRTRGARQVVHAQSITAANVEQGGGSGCPAPATIPVRGCRSR